MRRRSVAAGLCIYTVLVVAYYVFGLVLSTAAYSPGTTIRFSKELQLHQLVTEFARTSWRELWPDFPWFLTFLFVSTLAISWHFLFRKVAFQKHYWLVPAGGLALAGLFPGLWGLWSFPWTLANAFWLRGLDGEWLQDGDPVFEAFGFAYLIFLVAIVVALARHEAAKDPGSGRESFTSPEEPEKLTI